MICDFCGGEWAVHVGGNIILHEQHPEGFRDDDEIYNMCSYRCLKRWLNL